MGESRSALPTAAAPLPYVLLCDHASNWLPASFGTLGLDAAEMTRHIAWDPGALPVAAAMAEALDAPLVESGVSRLLIDCNRPLDAPRPHPGGQRNHRRSRPMLGLSPTEREQRIALSWTPFHDAIEAVVEERLARRQPTVLVSIHSFTPIYRGKSRPWEIGIIHDDDRRVADPLVAALRAVPGLTVGVNEPYSPADRVYFTLERHARSRGLPCAMIEIRNDEISDAAGQGKWADLLGGMFSRLEPLWSSGEINRQPAV